MMSALAAAIMLTACSGNGKTGTDDSASQDATVLETTLPVTSGEYRAVSFQDTAAGAVRTRFDGRILMALDRTMPEYTSMRTATEPISRRKLFFQKSLSRKTAYTSLLTKDNREITLIPGKENVDTLIVYRGSVPVKVSFETKPMSTLTPTEVWNRISTQLSK